MNWVYGEAALTVVKLKGLQPGDSITFRRRGGSPKDERHYELTPREIEAIYEYFATDEKSWNWDVTAWRRPSGL